MTYDLIQSALTAFINVVAIAGFAGCVLHSLFVSHNQFLAEFCPPVAPYKPDKEVEVREEKVIVRNVVFQHAFSL